MGERSSLKSCRITLVVGLKSSLSISNLDRPRATRAAHKHHLGTLKKIIILVLVSPGSIKATSLGPRNQKEVSAGDQNQMPWRSSKTTRRGEKFTQLPGVYSFWGCSYFLFLNTLLNPFVDQITWDSHSDFIRSPWMAQNFKLDGVPLHSFLRSPSTPLSFILLSYCTSMSLCISQPPPSFLSLEYGTQWPYFLIFQTFFKF